MLFGEYLDNQHSYLTHYRLSVLNRFKQRDCSFEIETIKHSSEGLVRHCVDECGNYFLENDLLGFVAVRSHNLPRRVLLNALLANAKDKLQLARFANEIHAKLAPEPGDTTATIDAHFTFTSLMMDKLLNVISVPELIWLGVISDPLQTHADCLPTWARTLHIVEDGLFAEYTFAYASPSTDLLQIAASDNVYKFLHMFDSYKIETSEI